MVMKFRRGLCEKDLGSWSRTQPYNSYHGSNMLAQGPSYAGGCRMTRFIRVPASPHGGMCQPAMSPARLSSKELGLWMQVAGRHLDLGAAARDFHAQPEARIG